MFRTFLFIYQYSFSSKIIRTFHLIKQMLKGHINTGFQHFLSLYSYYTPTPIKFNAHFTSELLSPVHGFFFFLIGFRNYRAKLIPVQDNGISKRIDDQAG